MRKSILLALVLLFGMSSVAAGKISTKVCLSDGNTPLELADPHIPNVYQDIMVGTKLTIIVSSDINGYWGEGGGLFVKEENGDYGILLGRDYNDTTLDWEGSRFPAAGNDARVWDWAEDVLGQGFMFSGDINAIAGDWFIIDYNSLKVGDCTVDFYDFERNLSNPVESLSFTHVVSRDFNNDTIVDFRDYAILTAHWRETGCNAPKWCDGTDLDINGTVDVNDLMLFCEFWLEKTK